MSFSGTSLREENIKNSRELLQETFADDASFALGIYMWEVGLESYEDKEPIMIRMYKDFFSNANGVTVKFQTLREYPIMVGDIVYSSLEDEYYICTEAFNINDIHWQGKFTLCNWILKWQDKKTGDILAYPCHDINSTQYNSGERSSKQITIGSSQHIVILPCDENTVTLSTPQRFFLDKNPYNPTSFIVTQNDTTSYNYGKKGLVRVTLMEYVSNSATDRIDLGVCDYIDKDKLRTDNFDPDKAESIFAAKSVISYDTTIIKSGGDFQTFTGKFFDENGKEVTGVVPRWEIICDFDLQESLEIEQSDNQIHIGINDDYFVDEVFRLVFSDDNGNYSSSLVCQIESLL